MLCDLAWYLWGSEKHEAKGRPVRKGPWAVGEVWGSDHSDPGDKGVRSVCMTAGQPGTAHMHEMRRYTVMARCQPMWSLYLCMHAAPGIAAHRPPSAVEAAQRSLSGEKPGR